MQAARYGKRTSLFGARGRAEVIRLALAEAGVPYVNVFDVARDNGFGPALAECPRLNAFFERVAARPRIAAYLASPPRASLTKFPG